MTVQSHQLWAFWGALAFANEQRMGRGRLIRKGIEDRIAKGDWQPPGRTPVAIAKVHAFRQYRADGVSVLRAARMAGISRATGYRIDRRDKGKAS